ncbi:TIGR02302 family protein [Candidatus Tokpelaia sp.]|uniref:TIGR02302 family protein n=1 Tax=Candidatus Tokpelaia sp. TaxID=2233777 RepID=UPI00123AC1E9|nr:TIGR02302 family protein [Candidatus Tokpelaia sp.]KAA6406045.1 TIGR02302 family protein [Candidatus Tokpelaia sp.]
MRRWTQKFARIAAFAAPMRRAAGKTFCVLIFERFWRRFLPLLLLFMVFAACCWLNLFAVLPPVIHIMLLVIFVAAFIAAGLFLYFLRRPTQAEIQARLERDNALHYGQLGLSRAILAGEAPPATRALWRAHKKRMQAQSGNLHLRPPRPNIPVYDRFALRSIVFLAFAVAFCFHLGGNGGHLGDAFYFGLRQPGLMRLDAWVSPPDYTGRPPVYLLSGGESFQNNGAAAGDKGNAFAAAAISVPQGSRLTLRLNDNGRGLAAIRCAGPGFKTRLQPQRQGAGSVYQLQLMRSATCTLSSPVVAKSWVFAVEPDRAPVIRWVKPPERALNGMLKLNYAVYDDYGVKKAWAEIEPADKQAQEAAWPWFARLTGPAQISRYRGGKLVAWQGAEPDKAAMAAGPAPVPLFPPPQIALNVPRPLPAENEARRGGTATTEAELTKNPWAGAFVTMRLVAEDGAGNKAVSAPISLILPQKTFVNPLSRALIEQRRLLVENMQTAPRLLDMLGALLLRPEKTIADKGAVLALYSLRARLKYALQPQPGQDAAAALRRQELSNVAAYMWAIAEGMDSGRLAEAEHRLALASQALREALRNGASSAEIARLMQDLRHAMQDYIAMLAERGHQNADNTGQKAPMLGESELEKRLKALEDAAKQGNRGRGEELLAEFEDLMKNLQVTQGDQDSGLSGGRNSQHSKMQQQMDNLSDIMRRQQQLLDETYKLREQNWREQSTETPARDKQRQDLQQRQGGLQRDLQALQRQLEAQGLSPRNDFKEAEQQMGESGRALEQGDERQSVENQARILQSLREGAQNLMGQMREALKKADEAQQTQSGEQGEGGGQDTASGLAGGGREQKNGAQDPLGRPAGTGQDMFIPQEEAGQRARHILEEIRKKLGNLTPQQEKDYLERLLNFE